MTARSGGLVLVTVSALVLQYGPAASAQGPGPAKPEAPAAAKPPAATSRPAVVQPRRFASPEDATQALVTALRTGEAKALVDGVIS